MVQGGFPAPRVAAYLQILLLTSILERIERSSPQNPRLQCIECEHPCLNIDLDRNTSISVLVSVIATKGFPSFPKPLVVSSSISPIEMASQSRPIPRSKGTNTHSGLV